MSVAKRARRTAGEARLLERQAELRTIDRFLDQASGGAGAVLVIDGLAGVGKTTLLQAAAERARARGIRVLKAAGTELERELSFAVVRGLLEPMLVEAGSSRRRALLAGAARLAAPAVWPRKTDSPSEPAAVLHGLFWLVSNIAESRPLMLAVDDAHWADQPTLRFLAYLARRLSGLAVLLVVATRPREPGARRDLVSILGNAPDSRVLSPSPLSEAAVGRLVASRFGRDPARAFVAACHTATGGNPFLLGELIAALLNDQVAATSENAAHVGRIGPPTVATAVLARIARVGTDAIAISESVAVLGGGELRQAAALAGLAPGPAAQALDSLAQIGVLKATRPLEFQHPLIQTAVYEAISPGRRSLAHGAAARMLAREDATPDRIAVHLLKAEPAGEAWVVDTLRDAAAAAFGGGAPDVAAGYLRRALAEPPAPEQRVPVLHELGAAELLARDPGATLHLSQALNIAGTSEARGEIALLLGRAAVGGGRLADARRLLAPVVEELAETRPGVVARLEAYRSAAGLWDPQFTTQLESELPRLRALAERAGVDGRSLLLMLAFRSVFEGRPPNESLALVDRGLEGGLLESESAEAIEITWAARVLTFIDELDRADRLVEEMVADSRRRGSVMGYASASAWRAAVALRRGQVEAAEADARAAIDLLTQHGLQFIAPHTYSFLGEAMIERGELDQAAALLAHANLGAMHGSRPEARFLHTRARVALARGNNQAAIADLRATEAQEPWFRNPNAMAWRSTLALALPQSSRAEALTLVDLELKRAQEIGQPRAIGVALRARGLLSDGEEGVSLLRQAVTTLQACPSQLELAHALTDLGSALRRRSRRTDAREVLSQALDLAAGCGARALATRARQELIIAGARPRRERLTGVEALTPSERRVAEMAASGMSNREIAQALFVTMKSVALHLTHVYEKLNIDGREELRGSLARDVARRDRRLSPIRGSN